MSCWVAARASFGRSSSFFPCGLNRGRRARPHLPECKLKAGEQHAKAVFHAAAEIDGGGLLEILRRAGNLADAEAEIHTLRQHLVVEDEVLRVLQQRQRGQHLAAEGAIAGVVFGELDAQEYVLEGGEEAVGNVFVERHATVQRPAADDARAQNDIIDIVGDHAGQRRDEQRRVLVIGVDHDHHVGAGGQGFAIAGLLVAAVAAGCDRARWARVPGGARLRRSCRGCGRPPGCGCPPGRESPAPSLPACAPRCRPA